MHKKTAIITGGAQGIGRAMALKFHAEGYNTIIYDIDTEAINEIQSDKDFSGIHFIRCDVSNEKQVIQSIDKAINQEGSIDVLVNNAAVIINKPVEILSLDEWNAVLGVNLTGTFLCSKHASEYLKKSRGTIINIASTRAFMSEAHSEAYSASKGGIVALTHALAVSLAPYVRVNCISPGWIEVSRYKKSSVRSEPHLSEADHQQHPAGRVGEASDIVNMVLFLASDENGFITGQNFIIDGGMTRKMIYI
ncbi:MAG: SDR family oxidoreductase [Bacteroidales bacterium]